MTGENQRRRLREKVERQSRRLKRAKREQHQWLAQTVFIGTLGLVFVIPVLIGAYLGLWLDGLSDDYSMSWTLSLILLGLLVGAINVYLLVKE